MNNILLPTDVEKLNFGLEKLTNDANLILNVVDLELIDFEKFIYGEYDIIYKTSIENVDNNSAKEIVDSFDELDLDNNWFDSDGDLSAYPDLDDSFKFKIKYIINHLLY